jgi:hypothetical protein
MMIIIIIEFNWTCQSVILKSKRIKITDRKRIKYIEVRIIEAIRINRERNAIEIINNRK